MEELDDKKIREEMLRHERVKRCLSILEEMQYGKKGWAKMQTKLSRFMDTERCSLSPQLVLVVKNFEIKQVR